MSSKQQELSDVFGLGGSSGREIRFIDSRYHPLFSIPDGGNIVRTNLNGRQDVLCCEYIDETHAKIGGSAVYHICQFAEFQEQTGAVYAPEFPRRGDVCDTYEFYQIQDTRNVTYSFLPYQSAIGKLRRDDYLKVYAGVLAKEVTLEDLFLKHNRDNRPYGQKIRSLSVSDVVILIRNGIPKAYYVDLAGFQEVPEFLDQQPQAQRRMHPTQKKKRGGESR